MKKINHYDLLYNHPEKIMTRLKTQFQKRIRQKFTNKDLEKISQIEDEFERWYHGYSMKIVTKIFEVFVKEKLKETLDQVLLDEFKFDQYSCFTEYSYYDGIKFRNARITKNTSLGQLFTNIKDKHFFKLKITKGNYFQFFDTDFKFQKFNNISLSLHEDYFKNIFVDYMQLNNSNENSCSHYPFDKYLEKDFYETIKNFLQSKGIDFSLLNLEVVTKINKRYFGNHQSNYIILLNLNNISQIFTDKYKDYLDSFFSIDDPNIQIGKIEMEDDFEFVLRKIIKSKEYKPNDFFNFSFLTSIDTFMERIGYISRNNLFKRISYTDETSMDKLVNIYDKAQDDTKIFNENVIKPVYNMLKYLDSDNTEFVNFLKEKIQEREYHCYKHFHGFSDPYIKILNKYLYEPDFSIVDFLSVCKFKYSDMFESKNLFQDNIILENSRRE